MRTIDTASSALRCVENLKCLPPTPKTTLLMLPTPSIPQHTFDRAKPDRFGWLMSGSRNIAAHINSSLTTGHVVYRCANRHHVTAIFVRLNGCFREFSSRPFSALLWWHMLLSLSRNGFLLNCEYFDYSLHHQQSQMEGNCFRRYFLAYFRCFFLLILSRFSSLSSPFQRLNAWGRSVW